MTAVGGRVDLLPRTDAGVAAQLVLLVAVGGAALAATWRHRELRVLVAGVLAVLLGLAGIRALH